MHGFHSVHLQHQLESNDSNERGCHKNLQGLAECSRTISGTLSLNNAGALDEKRLSELCCDCIALHLRVHESDSRCASNVQRARMYC